MPVMIVMCERTQCIAACCIWGCIATKQCDHLDSCPQWAHEHQNWTLEQCKKLVMSNESCFLLYNVDSQVCVHVAYLGRDGTRMHNGKKESWYRQGDVL